MIAVQAPPLPTKYLIAVPVELFSNTTRYVSLTTAVVGAEPSVISTVGVCSSQAVFAVTYFQIPNDEVEGFTQ